MSKTLKTYPDGSELTTTGLAAIVGVGLAATAISVFIAEKLEARAQKRITQKAIDTLNEK